MQFVIDAELVAGLQQYFPLQVDFDERTWHGIRVRVSRTTTSCC